MLWNKAVFCPEVLIYKHVQIWRHQPQWRYERIVSGCFFLNTVYMKNCMICISYLWYLSVGGSCMSNERKGTVWYTVLMLSLVLWCYQLVTYLLYDAGRNIWQFRTKRSLHDGNVTPDSSSSERPRDMVCLGGYSLCPTVLLCRRQFYQQFTHREVQRLCSRHRR